MRMHISLADELVAELDRRVAPRQRSAFVTAAIESALDAERRWDDIESALATLDDTSHDWDNDPAAWVRAQRAGDPRRSG